MARMTAETRRHVEGFKAVKVKHPRLDEVDQQVTQAIDEHAGYTHLLLYGPSGVGKSTVMRRIAERFCTDDPDPAHVPVVLIEARPSDTGTYVRLDYYRQVLLALKAHGVVQERLVNITTAPTPTRASRHATEWLDLREAVEQALERLHVKAVSAILNRVRADTKDGLAESALGEFRLGSAPAATNWFRRWLWK